MHNFPDTPRNRSRSPASSVPGCVCPVSVVHQPATHCALVVQEKYCHHFSIHAFPPLNHRPRTSFVRERIDDRGAECSDVSVVLLETVLQGLEDSSRL